MNWEDRIKIRERRHAKIYDNFIENLRLGYLIERGVLKHEPEKEDEKRYQAEWYNLRKQGILERFNRKRGEPKRSILPLNHHIIIRIDKGRVMNQILEIIDVLFDPEEVYQYDPMVNGMGYKYYKGERIIVYQIDKWMSMIEKSRIENQIEKKKVMNKNKEDYDIEHVYKIVIVKSTKWHKKNMEGWHEYKPELNGWCAMLNIVTHGVLEEKEILDKSREMNQMLKELDRRFL